jgi:hypothetical protein
MAPLRMAVTVTLLALALGVALAAMPTVWRDQPDPIILDWAQVLCRHDCAMEALLVRAGIGGEVGLVATKFPLFALGLVRPLVAWTGMEIAVAAFVVKTLALGAGAGALWALARQQQGASFADRAVGYLFFTPMAGYTWLLTYPEPLYLLWWSLGMLWFFEERYTLAAIVTCLAALTRPQAAPILATVFGVSLLVSFVRQVRTGNAHITLDAAVHQVVGRGLLLCLLPMLVFAAWLAHTSVLTGTPLAPLTLQAAFGRRSVMFPWVRVVNYWNAALGSPLTVETAYNSAMLLLVLVGGIAVVWATGRGKLRWELALFTWLSLLLPLATGISGMGRFALLSWAGVALVYLVPKRWDGVVWLLSMAVTLFATWHLLVRNAFTP